MKTAVDWLKTLARYIGSIVRKRRFNIRTKGLLAGLFAAMTLVMSSGAWGQSVLFTFGPNVANGDQQLVKETIAAGDAFFQSRLGTTIAGTATVFVFEDIELLVDEYMVFYNIPVSQRPKILEMWKNNQCAVSGFQNIFIDTSATCWIVNHEGIDRVRIIMHEYAHVLEFDLVGSQLGCCLNDEVPAVGPQWMLEGVAEYLSRLFLGDQDAIDFREYIRGQKKIAKMASAPLSELETRSGLLSEAFSFSLLHIAVDFAVSLKDLTALVDFWGAIGDGASWQTAFQSSFSLSIDDFYEEFEAYRSQGFRRFEIHEDFDDDGDSDIFWRHAGDGRNMLWVMEGLAREGIANLPKFANTNWQVAGLGDFTDEGTTGVLWRNQVTGGNKLWEMDGATQVSIRKLPKFVNTDWEVAGVADFTGDGKADILWHNKVTAKNKIWEMDGATRLAKANIPKFPNSKWQPVGVVDFNGNGTADILWRNGVTGANKIWEMDGFNRTANTSIPAFKNTDWAVAGLGDFDKDGKADILWRNEVTGGNKIWLMNGTVRKAQSRIPRFANTSWQVVGTGDYDGSEESDILWRNVISGANKIWLMQGFTRAEQSHIPKLADTTWQVEP